MEKPIILTTACGIDGYEISEYIDVIYADTIYKASLLKALSGKISDTIDSFRLFSNNELSGTSGLIREAKDYVKESLIKKAQDLGANAIIGIDIDASINSDGLTKVSIHGTAVKISPKANKCLEYIIPVVSNNKNTSFKASSIKLSVDTHGCRGVLEVYSIYNTSNLKLSGMVVDIVFKTLFDEDLSVTDEFFVDFKEERYGYYIGSNIMVNIPPKMVQIIKSASVIIKKYVLDEQTVTSSSSTNNISASPSEDNIDIEVLFSPNEFIAGAQKFRSAREILNYTISFNEQHNNVIKYDLLDIIKKHVNFERVYGNDKEDCIADIIKYFS